MRWLNRAGLVMGLIAFAPMAGAQSSDSILSRHIKEADGTSGQDTNTGSGVKTGHVQDSAVTNAKLANGAVTSSKVLDGAITTQKIADGAVTDVKIAGPISAAKINGAGLNADTVDGLHAGAFSRRSARMVVVAADGTGDFNDVATAIASITSASRSTPFLVKVMPGEYALASALAMKPFVDLQGSGEGVTRLVAFGQVLPSRDSEIRDVTLDLRTDAATVHVGQGSPTGLTKLSRVTVTKAPVIGSSAIELGSEADAAADRVTVVVQGSQGAWAQGVFVGGRVTMRQCHVNVVTTGASAYGIVANDDAAQIASLLLEDSRVTATIGGAGDGPIGVSGVHVAFAAATVRNTMVTVQGLGGGDYALSTWGRTFVEQSTLTVNSPSGSLWAIQSYANVTTAAYTRVKGAVGPAPGGGTVRCIGLYDEDARAVTCP